MNKLPQIAIPVEKDIFRGFRIYAAMRGLTVAAAGRELIEKVVLETELPEPALLVNARGKKAKVAA